LEGTLRTSAALAVWDGSGVALVALPKAGGRSRVGPTAVRAGVLAIAHSPRGFTDARHVGMPAFYDSGRCAGGPAISGSGESASLRCPPVAAHPERSCWDA
jgi:hypothetical protein